MVFCTGQSVRQWNKHLTGAVQTILARLKTVAFEHQVGRQNSAHLTYSISPKQSLLSVALWSEREDSNLRSLGPEASG